MKLKNLFIFVTTLCALSSCTSMKKITLLNDNKSGVQTHEVSYDIHKLQVGDLLHVKIIGINEEANRLFNIESAANNLQTTSANLYMTGFNIDSEGNIKIPTIGKIQELGLSLEETRDLIQTKVNEFLIDATVIVKHVNFQITILGEVNKAGTYTIFKDKISIFEALGLASDLTDYASRKKVKLIRGNKIMYIDLTDENVLSSSNFYLKANDVIYVEPLSNVRMRSSNASIYISAISTLALVANIAFNILTTK